MGRNRYFTVKDVVFRKGNCQKYVHGRHIWDDAHRSKGYRFVEIGIPGSDAGSHGLPEGAHVRFLGQTSADMKEAGLETPKYNVRVYTHVVNAGSLVKSPRLVRER